MSPTPQEESSPSTPPSIELYAQNESTVAHLFLARHGGNDGKRFGESNRLAWRSNDISWVPPSPALRQLESSDDERDGEIGRQTSTSWKRCKIKPSIFRLFSLAYRIGLDGHARGPRAIAGSVAVAGTQTAWEKSDSEVIDTTLFADYLFLYTG
jgi:hypothetical protein